MTRLTTRIQATIAALCLLPGLACVSTRVEPLQETAELSRLDEDERELWDDSERLDRYLRDSTLLYSDEALQKTLDEVAGRLLPPLGAPKLPVRVLVLLDQTQNAFALPNGSVYIHSGLLVRLHNEAQLAALLGHELTHAIERHALRQTRSRHNRKIAAATVNILLAGVVAGLTGDTGLAQSFLDLGSALSESLVRAQVAGYGRDLEREADRKGLAAVAVAGWSAKEAIDLYRVLLEGSEPDDAAEPFLYASHPHLEERIRDSRKQANELGGGERRIGEESYMKVVRPLVYIDVEAQIRQGRPDRALATATRHANWMPEDPRMQALLGRAMLGAGSTTSERDEVLAVLERARAAAPDDPDIARQIGLLHHSRGNHTAAREALEHYLALEPDALDRMIVEDMLAEMTELEANEGTP